MSELWRRRIRGARSVALTALVTYAGFGASLVSAPMLAHALGPSGRGSLAAAFAAVQVISWIAFLGLPRGLNVQQNSEGTSSALGALLIGAISCITAVACFLLAPELSNGDDWTTAAIQVASGTLVLAGAYQIGVEFALIRGRIPALNFIRAFNLLIPSVGYIVAFILGGLTIETAFLITLCGQLGASLAGLIVCIPLLRRLDRRPPPWSFSLRVWASTVSEGIAARVDQMILAIVSPAASLGVYAIAATGAAASGGLTQAINAVAYGRMARQGAGQQTMLRSRSLIGVASSILASAAVVTFLGLFNVQILGPGFGGITVPLAVLCLAQLLNDQWQLRVFAQSAMHDSSWLLLPSIGGLIAMATSITIVLAAAAMSPFAMSLCVLSNSLVRLAIWSAGNRSRSLT